MRRSDGFDVWTKEIPRVGHKFPMYARDYRKLMEVYENPRLSESAKVKQIEKLLTHDMKDAYLGCKDVMDFIALMAFSNWGVAQFVPEINNPGGRKYEWIIKCRKQTSWYQLSCGTLPIPKLASCPPFLMLSAICSDLRNRGIEPGEILMSQDLYFWLRMDETTRLLVHGNDKKAQTVTTAQMADLLAGNEIPPVTVITRKMGMDMDGKRKSLEPWNHNFICIKPAGVIGEIQPAIEDSELIEEEKRGLHERWRWYSYRQVAYWGIHRSSCSRIYTRLWTLAASYH